MYRLYLDTKGLAYVEFSEEEFNELDNCKIRGDGQLYKAKKISVTGASGSYIIISPIESFERY